MALRVIIMVFHEYMDFALHNSGFSLSISGISSSHRRSRLPIGQSIIHWLLMFQHSFGY